MWRHNARSRGRPRRLRDNERSGYRDRQTTRPWHPVKVLQQMPAVEPHWWHLRRRLLALSLEPSQAGSQLPDHGPSGCSNEKGVMAIPVHYVVKGYHLASTLEPWQTCGQEPSASQVSISISWSRAFSGPPLLGPLSSVRMPTTASASFWVYGSSFNCLTLEMTRLAGPQQTRAHIGQAEAWKCSRRRRTCACEAFPYGGLRG